MKELKLLLILPLSVSSESNLPFCVLLIDAILELKLLIEPDNDELKLVIVLVNPLVVIATDEDKLSILELNPLVVVAIELDKEPIDDVNEELKLVMVLVNPDVVVATELEKDDV